MPTIDHQATNIYPGTDCERRLRDSLLHGFQHLVVAIDVLVACDRNRNLKQVGTGVWTVVVQGS